MKTATPDIVTAKRSDAPSLLHVLALAFAGDPVCRYWWPDESDFMRVWPRFALAMGERGFEAGTVFSTRDHKAAAFWLPPGVDPDPAQLAALNFNSSPDDEAVSNELQAGLARYYLDEPHWYLWWLGADPVAQGQGLGSALLQHTLKEIDEAQQIAFLENSNPKNTSFYERHGFKVVGETRVANVPVITSMMRLPRA